MSELNVGKLADDLQSLVSDAEELLRATPAGRALAWPGIPSAKAALPCAPVTGYIMSSFWWASRSK